jgi:hypothetical protein
LWDSDRTTVFNIKVLNSAVYKSVTGETPPTQPMGAKTYKQQGLPFFRMYEEPSGGPVKSIARIDKKGEEDIRPKLVPIGLINPLGPLREFRTVRDLKKVYSGYHVASF